MRIVLILSLFLISACASTRDHVKTHDNTSSIKVQKLTAYAKSLLGVPYKYGGNSPNTGFDCSGYVGHVFKKMAGVSLPHNSRQISGHGIRVKSAQLREGDLVFFDTNNKPYSHVGIYLGDDSFIHAPSNGGEVRVEDMNMNYWNKHYNGARRITSQR